MSTPDNPVCFTDLEGPAAVAVCLDSPVVASNSMNLVVRGWASAREEILDVTLIQNDGIGLGYERRVDVESKSPQGTFVYGFAGVVPSLRFPDYTLRFRIRTANFELFRTFPLVSSVEQSQAIRKGKLAKLAEHFRCPNCETKLPTISQGTRKTVCPSCAKSYSSTEGALDFLPEELKRRFQIEATANVSQNDYDLTALNLIGALADGLILDCGAGYRKKVYPNVVNFEIVPYTTTDVLGVNESLPFCDNTFDAVFSLSVLEHVSDPFRSAAEISRVLKPGGTLYCAVPFLQPLHGYPHHYFNMSQQGLAQLFKKHIQIEQAGVARSGRPIWTLAWFLRSWAAGLKGETKQSFLKMRVEELIGKPETYLNERFVSELSVDKNAELASATIIIGKKSTTQRLNDSTTQRLNDSTTQRLNDSTTQRLSDSATQRLSDSATQRLSDSAKE